ncbi:Predicted pyrophosphatase or phosphodiesterase, AlkP superfamily [Flavobacteriaceae bacterium MAR_2010_188]|nr:Predicted pyrophosphatase or phosphodiesterase, AlkP superfamily [Flavobacteriaceae bacterium MAR_2010_188]
MHILKNPKSLFFILSIFFLSAAGFSQNSATTNTEKNSNLAYFERPKLVVGIVVDQMRYDYLTRFYNRYGEGGFKRMINEGYNCKNNHYNYVPTYTGPGHASIYTGAPPKYHGIIGNNWYDKEIKQDVYCTADPAVKGVGTSGYEGEMSPWRMKSTTFSDENRLFTQMRGKTIGISLKDRGSILPAGHTANAAYWYVGGTEGNFVTSSYYMNELPQWVKTFNESGKMQSYIKPWEPLYDIATYLESGDDLNEFEAILDGKKTAEFPYDLKELSKGQYGLIRATPYGNSLTADFAIAAINGEDLGQDDITDVLTVSFSSTDYIGHSYGVNSKEVEDAYLRLDQDLARLFESLDNQVGKGNYVAFLTSDHGAIDVPAYLKSNRIPSGYFDDSTFKETLSKFVREYFKTDGLIENISNNQIFLNRAKLSEKQIDLTEVQTAIVNEIISYPNIDKAYTAATMTTSSFTDGIEMLIQNGFDQKRSGDVIYAYDPGFLSYPTTGSSHGSSFNYDTHVPLIFYGKGIKRGYTYSRTEVIDIAPTMSALLGISFPNTSVGNPLEFVFQENK